MIPRYTLPRMGKIWEEGRKFSLWLKIEILVCEAWAKLGKIPPEAVEKIKKRAKFSLPRIQEIEKKVKHDVIAFLTNVAENVGPEARFIHLGLTSSDLLDTALALQLKEASQLILEDIEKVIQALLEKAKDYKYTPMMGRTHGVHAEPTTLGLKFLGWVEEMKRNRERFLQARENISYGKISGAVGTYAQLDPWIEKYVCEKLGLKVEPVSTQIIQRDRHAQFLSSLAILSSSLERFSTEIRSLHRTEIGEIEEGFGLRQKGSSAMPHKKNPIHSERVCGLSRMFRGWLVTSLENIPLWGERDISHSSPERIILPDACILIDYILNLFLEIIENLVLHPEKMRENIDREGRTFFSQRVLLALVEKGMMREEAYSLIQRLAFQSRKEKKDFEILVREEEEVKKYLSSRELDSLFNLNYYLRWVDKIFARLGIE